MVKENDTPCITKWLSASKARHKLGVCSKTLRNWDAKKLIQTRRTPTGIRLYDVSTVLRPSSGGVRHSGHSIVYARVSSSKQKGDLERQIEFLSEKFPGYKIIRDIGSGINWRRPGLRTILRYCLEGSIREVVVAHRDRLSRLGFELIEFLIKEAGGKLVVLDKGIHGEEEFKGETELGEDLLSIIHVFSSRHYGSRKYKKSRDTSTKKTTEKVGNTQGGREGNKSKEDKIDSDILPTG